ncbi:MAG: hypothetical protein Q7S19_02170 [bacterium]|nr:hypothetical protein [bacterium]
MKRFLLSLLTLGLGLLTVVNPMPALADTSSVCASIANPSARIIDTCKKIDMASQIETLVKASNLDAETTNSLVQQLTTLKQSIVTTLLEEIASLNTKSKTGGAPSGGGKPRMPVDCLFGQKAVSEKCVDVPKTPPTQACIPAGKSLGAVVPTNTAVCCPGLVTQPPRPGITGGRGTCQNPTPTTSFSITSPLSGTYTLGKDTIHVAWSPASTPVNNITLYSNSKSDRYGLWTEQINNAPSITTGSFDYKLPNDLTVFPGTYHIEIQNMNTGTFSTSANAPLQIVSPLGSIQPSTGPYKFASTPSAKLPLITGEQFSFTLKGIEDNGTPASSSKGFNVQYHVYDSAGNFMAGDNEINNSEGTWTATTNNMQLAPGSYSAEITLYCSLHSLNSVCAQKYHNQKQVVQKYNFVVTSNTAGLPTPTASVTDLRATVGTDRITLNWTPATTNGAPSVGYDVLRSGIVIAQVSASQTYVDISYTPGRTYTYQLKDSNGVASNTVTATAPSATPANLKLGLITLKATLSPDKRGIQLTWNKPTGGSVMYYTLSRDNKSVFSSSAQILSSSISGNALSYIDYTDTGAGLPPGIYTYRLYVYGDPAGNNAVATSPAITVPVTQTAPSITITNSASPVAQSITAGSQNFTFANIQFDASQSSEDISFATIKASFTNGNGGLSSDITSCVLYDPRNHVRLTNESNDVNPLSGTGDYGFRFDNGSFVIPKGTISTLSLNCNVSLSAASGSYFQWGIPSGTNQIKGVGVTSGNAVTPTGTAHAGQKMTIAVTGVRTFKSFPTVTMLALPTNTLSNGTKSLMRFKVTASASGDVGLYKFTIKIKPSLATVNSVNAYAYTDSGFSTAVSGIGSNGNMLRQDKTDLSGFTNDLPLEIYPENNAGVLVPIQIPAGQTRYFDVTGSVSGSRAGASISTQLEGDSAYPTGSSPMLTAVGVDSDVNSDFIWSPNSRVTSDRFDQDWTNGFGVVGLNGTNNLGTVISASIPGEAENMALKNMEDQLASLATILAQLKINLGIR